MAQDDRYRVEIDVGQGTAPHGAPPVPESDTPFTIALVGDFSARANRGRIESGRAIADRRPVRVDRDSVDDAIARVAPVLELRMASDRPPIDIRFATLDDFHPDRLYERLAHLAPLREMRERLASSSWASTLGKGAGAAPVVQPPSPRAGAGGLLDLILGDEPPAPIESAMGSPSDAGPNRSRDDEFSEFLRRAVEPHLVAGSDPRQQALLAEADTMIAAELRAILHHPDYQRLESCWRGVEFLTRRLDTGDSLRLVLVDVSKEELEGELGAVADDDLAATGSYRLLTKSGSSAGGDQPWALMIGLYEFGPAARDCTLLGRLAEVARAAGAPWLSGAAPTLVGSSSFATMPDVDDWDKTIDGKNPAWTRVRNAPAARHAGLVAPRFLLRLPYGEDTDSCETLRFEELESGAAPDPEHYLWGNGALACALLLGDAFDQSGWTLRPGLEVTGLPLHIVRVDGEVTATPCAEGLLSDRALIYMLDQGVMPLASRRDGDTIRRARFKSTANPLAALAGRWRTG